MKRKNEDDVFDINVIDLLASLGISMKKIGDSIDLTKKFKVNGIVYSASANAAFHNVLEVFNFLIDPIVTTIAFSYCDGICLVANPYAGAKSLEECMVIKDLNVMPKDNFTFLPTKNFKKQLQML